MNKVLIQLLICVAICNPIYAVNNHNLTQRYDKNSALIHGIKKHTGAPIEKKTATLSTYESVLKKINFKNISFLHIGSNEDLGFYQLLKKHFMIKDQNIQFCNPENNDPLCMHSIENHKNNRQKSAYKKENLDLIIDSHSSFNEQGLERFSSILSKLNPGGIYIFEIKDHKNFASKIKYIVEIISNDNKTIERRSPESTWTTLRQLFGFKTSKRKNFSDSENTIYQWVESITFTEDLIIINKRNKIKLDKSSAASKSQGQFKFKVCSNEVTQYFKPETSTNLHHLHQQLNIYDHNICDELPEQLMNLQYISPGDRVLELGANIGRSTLVLAHQVGPYGSVTASEVNPEIRKELERILSLNKVTQRTKVIPAIGKTNFIYRDWTSKLWDENTEKTIPKGWTFAKSINYPKSNFNVLVADCEGCILPLLEQYPDMLNGIEKIIIENDADDNTTKKIQNSIKKEGFTSKLCIPIEHGYWNKHSKNSKECFYQLWVK